LDGLDKPNEADDPNGHDNLDDPKTKIGLTTLTGLPTLMDQFIQIGSKIRRE